MKKQWKAKAMNRKNRFFIGILGICALLTACGNGEQREESQSTEAIPEKQTETEELSPYQKACKTLLEADKDGLWGAYEPSQAFLDWVGTNYGEDALTEIGAEIAEGQEAEGENTNTLWYETTGSSLHVLEYEYALEADGIGVEDILHQQIYEKECASDQEIVLDFTGDMNFAEDWYTTQHMDACANGIYDCISYELRQEMASADILTINNEFVYSTRGQAIEGKAYTYRANPSRVSNLTALGVDLVGLANNHACDYGEEALLDTFDTLEWEGIPYVGAGRNLDQAMEPVYFIANGRKISIVAATQIEKTYNYTKQATEESPGVLKCLDDSLFVEEIQEAKANSDYCIVFVHWGTEHQAWYQADQTQLAEDFAEAGADAIIGGHTHCLQGISYVEGIPVFYSLGNFWQSKATLDTGIAQLVIGEDGSIKARFIPCLQANVTTSLSEGEEKERILNYEQSISTGISLDEEGWVTQN